MNYLKSKMDRQVRERRKLASYSSVGMMFPASIAVGVAMGYFLDKWLHTEPYLLIAFTLYGIAAGFRNLIKVTMKHSSTKEPEPGNNSENHHESNKLESD